MKCLSRRNKSDNVLSKTLPLSNRFVIFVDSKKNISVTINQKVLRGQPLIFFDLFSVPVHAPTSGLIEDISFCLNPSDKDRKNVKIVILSDHLDKWIRLKPIENYEKYGAIQLIEIIHNCGVVGLGGGQFPSAKKLMLSINKVHTLIVNAVESEPYITADNCLINNYTNEILKGCEIVSWISNIKLVLIVIQEDKLEAISKVSKCIKNRVLFKVCIIKNKYPGGSSKVLIKSLTGKEVPCNKHSIDIGYLVFNVATIYAIKRSIINGEPLTERIVTCLRDNNFSSSNVWVRIGTPIKYFLNFWKYQKHSDFVLYFGGPFMGKEVKDLNYSIMKHTNCISIQFKKKQHKKNIESNCIRCSYCSSVCPVNLLPQQLYIYSKNGQHEKTKKHYVLDCIECKACEKVCPSNIPLVEYFKKEKKILKAYTLENNLKKISYLRFKKRQERLSNKKRIIDNLNINKFQILTKANKNINNSNKNIRKKQLQEAIQRVKNKK